MSLTSNMFFLFTVLGLCIYYVVPKRLQWIVLLVLSYAYYLITSVPATAFLIFSTVVTYGAAIWISRVKESGEQTENIAKKQRELLHLESY